MMGDLLVSFDAHQANLYTGLRLNISLGAGNNQVFASLYM